MVYPVHGRGRKLLKMLTILPFLGLCLENLSPFVLTDYERFLSLFPTAHR